MTIFYMCPDTKAQASKYTNHTETGVMIGFYGGLPFSLQTFNGVNFHRPKIAAGITLGIDSYQQMVLVPVALGIRYPANNTSKTQPYVAIDAGYSFDWLEYDTKGNQYGGGWMINPAIGLKFRSVKRNRITLSLGYKQQLAAFHSESQGVYPVSYAYTATRKYNFNRITFRIGISH